MSLPLVKQTILDKLESWRPSKNWPSDSFKNAETLVTNCREIYPFVAVLYNVLQRRLNITFEKDFVNGLDAVRYIIADSLKTWITSNETFKAVNGEGRSILQMGIMSSSTGRLLERSDLNLGYLQTRFPSIFYDPKKTPDGFNPRVGDILGVVSLFGDLNVKLTAKGKTLAEKYVLISYDS